MSVTINGIGFVENSITLDTDYTLADNRNAMSAGPVTVADGITITVGDGSTNKYIWWTSGYSITSV
jgi:hypothetical protein